MGSGFKTNGSGSIYSMNYTVLIYTGIGDHHVAVVCDEEDVSRWRTAGRIVARAEQNDEMISRFFRSNGFIIQRPNGEEYLSPMDIKMIQIIKRRED